MKWQNIPSLAGLRAFEAAARHQSLSRAAAELNVTHAAINQHVRNLEADFGESLLMRQGRGVSATPAGAELARHLNEGFEIIAQGVDALRDQNAARPLNVSVTPAFASQWLMPRIGEFWDAHPDIKVNINPAIDLIDLRKDGYDLAIRYGVGNWAGTQSQLLTDGDYWVVAHPSQLKNRQAACLEDVLDLPWFIEKHNFENRKLLSTEGVDFEKLNLQILANNSLVLSAITAGNGVTFQARSLVEDLVKAGTLTRICTLPQTRLGYHMVWLPNRESVAMRKFKAWLIKCADRDKASRVL